MPPKFRRKLSQFLPRVKIPLLVGVIFCLLGLSLLINPASKPACWWSVLFTNPLKQSRGLTNLLLLGIPGGDHGGADLTDTMIFLSLNQKNGKTILVSLPRDIWSPTLVAKINSAYHYGEEKNPASPALSADRPAGGPGGGLVLTKSVVEEIVGLPIQYAVKIDFAGFERIIDLLGGVEIEVEKTFDDYKFPIEGKENDLCGGDPEYKCRYQHLHFDKGRQLLDGKRALQYARSRYAEGEEGIDFARERRQQKLLLALKNKIFLLKFLLNPKKISQFVKILGETVETDVPQDLFPYFGKMFVKINSSKTEALSLENFLINPPTWQYGQWVLIPRTGDFGEIKEYLRQKIQY